MTASAPLIIGATGGSGTRVVARIAQRAGYNLGTHVNEANDALAFRPFHDRWINHFLGMEDHDAGSGDGIPDRMANDFKAALAHHLDSPSAEVARWGWKAPRSIYLLPFLYAQFPDLRFIHVLRDGRDMAFSRNQNQLRKHGPKILNWRERWFNPESVRSVLLWARINVRVAEFGETKLRENYLVVRFEDLCGSPRETVARILRFLHVDLDPSGIAAEEVTAPASVGRWRRRPAKVTARLTRAAEDGLRKFGYLD